MGKFLGVDGDRYGELGTLCRLFLLVYRFLRGGGHTSPLAAASAS